MSHTNAPVLGRQTGPSAETNDAAETRNLEELLRALAARGYRFVPPTPATHRRVISRPSRREAVDLRDVFGWSLPFQDTVLDAGILALMQAAGVLQRRGGRFRSAVRVASLGDRLFLHSPYPPSEDSVFFGPDTYRFVDFLRSEVADRGCPHRALDFGAGSGVGGIILADLCRPEAVLLADVNPAALRLAAANAAFAGVPVERVQASDLRDLEGPFDLIVANPPFIAEAGRTYSDGGGMHGGELSLQWLRAGAELLAEGGRMLVYTGSAICSGRDELREALARAFGGRDWELSYREIDPDIFGEELARPAYRDVERIAAVGIALRRPVSERRRALKEAKALLGAMMAGAPPG